MRAEYNTYILQFIIVVSHAHGDHSLGFVTKEMVSPGPFNIETQISFGSCQLMHLSSCTSVRFHLQMHTTALIKLHVQLIKVYVAIFG